MSRIGKRKLEIPTGVTVTVNENVVSVKGPKGELSLTLHDGITHIGESGMSGQLISFCRDQRTSLWYKFDDAIVTPVNNFQNEVINFGMPYLLFYQKGNTY